MKERRAMLAVALPIYVVVAAIAACVAIAFGRSPLETESWLGTSGAAAVVLSLGLGAILAGATVAATRVVIRRFAWGRALHADLRPVVAGAGDRTIAALAVASGVAEELLFRGLLVPLTGVLASTALFALLHQIRGRARLAWIAWAAVTGLLLAVIFRATGSLAGAVLAHVAINAANLRVLRDVAVDDKHDRPLGGLLRRA